MRTSPTAQASVSPPASVSAPPASEGAGLEEPQAQRAVTPPAPPAPTPAGPPPPAPAPIIEELPSVPPRLSVSSYWYEGADGYRRAKHEHESARAPMLVYFRVDWCHACQRMDSEVLPASAVRSFLADVVKVRVNVESSDAERSLAKAFGVTGYPSVFVIPSPNGRPEKVSAFTRAGTEDITVTAEKFVEACTKVGLRQSQGLVVEAYRKLKAGELAAARDDLGRAIELDPKNAEAHYWRGLVALRQGEPGKAAGDLKRAIDLDPKEPNPYVQLATLYSRAGQHDDAVITLGRLVDAAPEWEMGAAFAMRGHAHTLKGDHARAKPDFAEACRRGNARACQASGGQVPSTR